MTAAAQPQGRDPGSGPVWRHSLLVGAAAWPPTTPGGFGEAMLRAGGQRPRAGCRTQLPGCWPPPGSRPSCQGCRQSGLPPTASAGSRSRPLPLPHVHGHLPSSARAPGEAGRRAFSPTPAPTHPSRPQGFVLGARRDVARPLLPLLELPGRGAAEPGPGSPVQLGAGLWSTACATRWRSASPKFTSLTEP